MLLLFTESPLIIFYSHPEVASKRGDQLRRRSRELLEKWPKFLGMKLSHWGFWEPNLMIPSQTCAMISITKNETFLSSWLKPWASCNSMSHCRVVAVNLLVFTKMSMSSICKLMFRLFPWDFWLIQSRPFWTRCLVHLCPERLPIDIQRLPQNWLLQSDALQQPNNQTFRCLWFNPLFEKCYILHSTSFCPSGWWWLKIFAGWHQPAQALLRKLAERNTFLSLLTDTGRLLDPYQSLQEAGLQDLYKKSTVCFFFFSKHIYIFIIFLNPRFFSKSKFICFYMCSRALWPCLPGWRPPDGDSSPFQAGGQQGCLCPLVGRRQGVGGRLANQWWNGWFL